MKVLGVIPTKHVGAVEGYRVLFPLRAMEKLGHKTAVFHAQDLWDAVKAGQNPFAHVDMVLFQRLFDLPDDKKDHWSNFVTVARLNGCSVVADYDDDYTNEWRKVHEGQIPDLHSFSTLIVSTPHLKKVMKPYANRIIILPNLVVPELINQPFIRDIDGLSIGLTGSMTHKDDWRVVFPVLKEIAAKHPTVKIFCSGLVPDELRELPQLVTMRSLGTMPDKDTDNFFVPLDSYGYILRNIDILLAPVDPSDRFNWSKSNIKAIEGQMSARDINGRPGGCSVIASGDLPNYTDCISQSKTGFLVKHNDQKAWFEAIDRNITDVELRHNVQVAGHESAMKNWNIHTRIRERVAAFSEILEYDRKQRGKLLSQIPRLAGLETVPS